MVTFIHSLMLTSDVHIFELLCPRNSFTTESTMDTNTQRRPNSFCSNPWWGDTDKNSKEEINHKLYAIITTRKKISWMMWGRWVGWSGRSL